eukprot:gnl/MRDRNA2_/MRDRNA2_80137_c1_seq1.p1 gnl/MRDRNA2_/MRDRNA2_80137_c1~~gnl/MRDRNA2_/MRDRNA2_80137_c1_seq1.p1  ORF type:complete len:1291 (+),score=291.04 gnl/MRDRNA2_/MRDRNA2_80137_c1_seq1:319-3873(+)
MASTFNSTLGNSFNRPSDGTSRSSSKDHLEIRFDHLLDFLFPPNHALFKLAGKLGRTVVKVNGVVTTSVDGLSESQVQLETDVATLTTRMYAVKPGWKVVACNSVMGSADEVMARVQKAQKERKDCIISFEVDEETMRTLPLEVSRKTGARLLLNEALSHRSLEELGKMSEDEKEMFLQDLYVQQQAVMASAVYEVEVLLGKSAKTMQACRNLFTAAKKGNLEKLSKIIDSLLEEYGEQGFRELCFQRDGCGNVPLHHATTLGCARILVQKGPETTTLKNTDGQSPMHTYIARCRDKEKVSTLSSTFQQPPQSIWDLDENGVSGAMWATGFTRENLEEEMPPWDDFQTALEKNINEISPALEAFGTHWKGILHFHFFGEEEVWQTGVHTKRSEERLITLWQTLKRLFDAARAREKHAVDLIGDLLKASKGPCVKEFDPRQPYREEFMVEAWHLREKLASENNDAYDELRGDCADWVKKIEDFLAQEVKEDEELTELHIKPETLWGQGLHFNMSVPSWVQNFDMKKVKEDLQKVNMVKVTHDTAYDLLQLAIVQDHLNDNHEFALNEQDALIARWFGAWLRGVCQEHQKDVVQKMQELLGPIAVLGKTFEARVEAKRFERICERLQELWPEFLKKFEELEREGQLSLFDMAKAKMMLRQAASFITDINGCTFIATTLEDVKHAVEGFQKSGCLRRMKNGFHTKSKVHSGYRDIKLIVESECGVQLIVEVQILLESFYKRKKFMHLPYEIFRGSFDWFHLNGTSYERPTVLRLMEAGYTLSMFKQYRYTLSQLKHAYTPSDLKQAGFTASQFKSADFNASELKLIGFTHSNLREAGYDVLELKEIGCTASQVKEAGYLALEILQVNYSASELRQAGYSSLELKNFGYTASQKKEAGFSAQELKKAGYAAFDLKEVGYNLVELNEAQYNAQELKLAGYNASELHEVGCTALELKEAGYSLVDLMAGDYAVRELKEIGYGLSEFLEAECKILLLIVEFTVLEFQQLGYTLKKLREEGVSATQMKEAGFDFADVMKAGYAISELKEAGYTAKQMKEGGVSAKQMREGGVSAKEVKDAEFDLADVRKAGYTILEQKEAEYTDSEILSKEGFNASMLKQLKDAEYTVPQLQEAGFNLQELVVARFELSDFAEAGYTISELKEFYNGADFLHAGYKKTELKQAGFTCPGSIC